MYKKIRRVEAIDILKENMDFLCEMINNPLKCGSFILIMSIKNNESKDVTNIDLLNFKIRMEKEIRRISRKIEDKLGFEVPDGLK